MSISLTFTERRCKAGPTWRHAPAPVETITIYLLLTGITLLVFAETITFSFVNFDDDLYVYDAPLVLGGLTIHGIASAFTREHAHNWNPLTAISHMLDCQLYGLNAGGHHFTNIVLHTIAVLLLFQVLRQMTGAVWRSAAAAALFAIHPLHVESVAWVSERKDILSGVFFLLTMAAYLRYVRDPSLWHYFIVGIVLASGLMAKSMLVTVPFVLLLLDYWPLRRFRNSAAAAAPWAWLNGRRVIPRLLLEKVPWLVLSTGSCLVTFLLQKRAAGAIHPLPLLWRIENAITSYVIYLRKTFWPADLAVFYPHPNDSLPSWEVILATGLLLGITAAAVVMRRRRPYIFTGWLWYLGMLVPVIGLVQVGEQGRADRYTYLPHIGLFILVVWTVADISSTSRARRRFVAVASVTIIVALGWCARIQTRYWKNSEALWTHALAVTSLNDVAHNNLGYLCLQRDEVDKAVFHFEAALKIRSNKTAKHYDVASAFIQNNLGNALVRKGNSDEAAIHYEQAIKLQPDYADAHYNLGTVLLAQGRIDEAIAQLEKAVAMQPDDADVHTSLGNALLERGSLKEAIPHYERALEIAPRDSSTRNNLAWVLATSSDAAIRDGARAVSLAEQAVNLSGGKEPRFFRTLAAAYAESNQFLEAISIATRGYEMATAKSQFKVAQQLAGDLALYRIRTPLRRVF
jgi:protein O-mannosyl-transferase